MKDAYSFDLDVDGLKRTYQEMFDAYERVFTRCGLTFRPVEGEAGAIGGDVNHEFMAVAAVGEDEFVWCRSCDYAANTEVAVRKAPPIPEGTVDAPPMEKVHTPGLPGIAGVSEHLGVAPDRMLKSIAFEVDGELALALVAGDREVNPYLFSQAVVPRTARVLTDEDFDAHPEIPKGYIGPHYERTALVVADAGIRNADHGWVTGANEVDYHVRDAVLGRDFQVRIWADLATVVTGDPCPRCGAPLSVDRGIEVGQVFQLGTKYSEALDCNYTDEAGEQHPMVMGCYGIGVSRVVAAVAEEHHDDGGLAWPAAVAPYQVHLLALPGKGEAAGDVVAAADRIYAELTETGVEVLYDDREASPGVKFADADLLGMPVRLTVGAKGLGRGVVERRNRTTGQDDELAVDDVVPVIRAGVR